MDHVHPALLSKLKKHSRLRNDEVAMWSFSYSIRSLVHDEDINRQDVDPNHAVLAAWILWRHFLLRGGKRRRAGRSEIQSSR